MDYIFLIILIFVTGVYLRARKRLVGGSTMGLGFWFVVPY